MMRGRWHFSLCRRVIFGVNNFDTSGSEASEFFSASTIRNGRWRSYF